MVDVVKCLIVDDDPIKIEQIQSVVRQEVGDDCVEIEIASSVYESTVYMRDLAFDLLIVDLNLPLRHGEQPREDGGRRLLRQVSRGTNLLIRPSFVIGLTAFDDLAKKNLAEFHSHGWALVSYQADSTTWEDTIANQCRHLVDVRKRYRIDDSNSCDVAICTALAEPELSSVMRSFGTTPSPIQRDSNRYHLGLVKGERSECTVAAACASEMGTAAMAALATRMILQFRPRLFLLTGICAGIRSNIGDIVVAESAWNYESGKWSQQEEDFEAIFAPDPKYLPASAGALSALREFKANSAGVLLSLPADYSGKRSTTQPSLNFGPVACGTAVIESRDFVNELSFENRKVEGLEMESYGFYLACRNAFEGLEYAMIKGVCDTAKPPKTDDYQDYAAFLSARTAFEFVRHELALPGRLLGRD